MLDNLKLYEKINTEDKHIIDNSENKLTIDKKAFETIYNIIKHRNSVKNKLDFISKEIKKRGEEHDLSKLQYPELGWLIQMDKEPKYKYGTSEYFEKMKKWQKFFVHHYANNRHHPDHFKFGICDMTLIDLCEYIADIISYYDEMHVDDALKTVEEQKERFGFDEQLSQILKNTLLEYFSWIGDYKPLSEETNDSNSFKK